MYSLPAARSRYAVPQSAKLLKWIHRLPSTWESQVSMIAAWAARAPLIICDRGPGFPCRAAALAAANSRLNFADSWRSDLLRGAVAGERSAACTTRKKWVVWNLTASSVIAFTRGANTACGKIFAPPADGSLSYVGSEASLSDARNAVACSTWFWLVELYLSARMIQVVSG